jgi:hypothetical protein
MLALVEFASSVISLASAGSIVLFLVFFCFFIPVCFFIAVFSVFLVV